MDNNVLERFFAAEIMKWRYLKGLLISLFLQLIVVTLVSSVLQLLLFDITLSPISWSYHFLMGILRPSWLLSIPFPAICYVILTRIHVHSYSVFPWIPERRLQYFVQFCHPKKILHALGLVLVISFLFRHYVGLVYPQFTSLTLTCDKDGLCINQQSILIWTLGLVMSTRFAFKYFMQNYNCIGFEIAQAPLLVRVKSKISLRLILDSCSLLDVGPQLFISVCLIYGLFGKVFSQWVSSMFGYSLSSESHTLWMVYAHLFDVRFIITAVVCSVLLAYNLNCYLMIFQEVITEKVKLPLTEAESHHSTPETQCSPPWTLGNAFVNSSSLLQSFAFRQLKDVALERTHFGHQYRTAIFAISQPGGHPRNWLSIMNPSLNLIRNFCSKLKEANHLDDRERPSVPLVGSVGRPTDLNKNTVAKGSAIPASKWDQIKEHVKRFPLLCFLLSEFPDVRNRQIFAQSQSVIWAIEGLANLIAASYEIDKFGVVQKNIGDILTILVHLQMVVDKIGRGLPYRKSLQGSNFGNRVADRSRDHQLRRSLRFTLRSSLYIITNTFKESIEEIPLDDIVRTKLKSYLNFQET